MITNKDQNPIAGAVQFAFSGGLDFHVLAGSAVIDKGLSLVDVARDYDGVVRPRGSAYDMGAYEYFDAYIPPALIYLPLMAKAFNTMLK